MSFHHLSLTLLSSRQAYYRLAPGVRGNKPSNSVSFVHCGSQEPESRRGSTKRDRETEGGKRERETRKGTDRKKTHTHTYLHTQYVHTHTHITYTYIELSLYLFSGLGHAASAWMLGAPQQSVWLSSYRLHSLRSAHCMFPQIRPIPKITLDDSRREHPIDQAIDQSLTTHFRPQQEPFFVGRQGTIPP